MIKVAMIGAGSVVFSRKLTGDLLSNPMFEGATISYMDIDEERLEVAGKLCRKTVDALGTKATIETTMDRKEALRDADFVINMVQIGGFNSTLVDFEIPRKYGLNFTIADTTGPGGLFRALRTYPLFEGLVRDMAEVCPDAYLLNYSNPMCENMQSVFRNGCERAVGLCHSVQGTFNQLMRYVDEDPDQVAFTCAGVNHMAFYLRIEKDGRDVYPRLFAAMEDPKVYNTNKVRFELMRRLGYFVTESSEHNAEYCPWFIPHGQEYIDRYDVPIDEYLRRCDKIVGEFERMKEFARSDEPADAPRRSHEYGVTIIESIVSGEPAVVYGNMPNRGCIDNLPREAIVEAPTLVDRTGLHFAHVGELPPQLVAYVQPHVAQHELFIRAAQEGRRDHVYQACMFDPLTAATVPPDRIVEMCDEMIAAYGDELPPLEAETLVPTSGKEFPRIHKADLRSSWDAQKKKDADLAIREWKVIGPFPGRNENEISLRDPTPVDDLAKSLANGGIDTAKPVGAFAWREVEADEEGLIDLDRSLGRHEYAIAYGYAEWDEEHDREAMLRCGSDDGIRIWLNGDEVHEHEVRRSLSPRSDGVAVKLRAGANRLLVKVDNLVEGWGFSVSVPKPHF